ncbi:MAG TPA: aminoacyl-tRNA hydrolase [Coxiellaceae bacterium]|nr:aminoacyl-tRNA hydrolase [Coxiellaceae bacterium]
MSAHPIQLIVGLGNPGQQYENTRHNAGAWLIKQLANQHNTPLKNESKFSGSIAKIQINSQSCWLLKPSTYMNHNGQSIAAIARFYKIPAESILIAHDELDFSAGTIRIKQGGGHGGHNGLRDTITSLGSKNFLRLRIGIGHPGQPDDVSPYVLSTPSKHDKQLIQEAIDEGLSILEPLIIGNTEQAMHQLHSN